MKFSYTALRSDNQKLTGTLEALSLDGAREELHKMGLSVIALEESIGQAVQAHSATIPTIQTQGITTFYFLANDPQGKEVNGTIDSKDPYAAYKRLVSEYQFKVLDLYNQTSANPQVDTLRPQFAGWNESLKQEGIHKSIPRGEVRDEPEDEGEKMAEEIVQEIDHFILNTKKILEEHRSQYSPSFLEEIEKTLNNLERIRTSNNLKHITKVCNDLYTLISHPDIQAQGSQEGSENEYQSIVTDLKASGFVQNKFSFLEKRSLEKKAAGFEKVQGLFSKIQKKLKGNDWEKVQRKLNGQKEGFFSKWLNKNPEGGGSLTGKYFAYLLERNPILRRARKQEFDLAREQKRTAKIQSKLEEEITPTTPPQNKTGLDFSGFFMELDSFVGWLLFFYLIYFFLVSISIERGIGLPKDIVFRTLGSPLLLNISIFLLIAHLAFTLKIRHFQKNFLGSAFLLFLCFGVYALLMANF